jgi:hypothetical protein
MKSPSSSLYNEVNQEESEDVTDGFTGGSIAGNEIDGEDSLMPQNTEERKRVKSVVISSHNDYAPSCDESDIGTHSSGDRRNSILSRGSIGSDTHKSGGTNTSLRASISFAGDSHIGKTVKSMGIWSR